MRYALVNPHWTFEGSIYFGCREPHLPLELGYAKALLEQAGHDVLLLDASLEPQPTPEIRDTVHRFQPDFTVIPTAPSYLFWRCPPPELSVPRALVEALAEDRSHRPAGRIVLIGPHPSTTPATTLAKVGADIAVLGESDQVLPDLAGVVAGVQGIARRINGQVIIQGGRRSADLERLPALDWPRHLLAAHSHHHHRFDHPQTGLGAEIESSRGCPYSCSFCAKSDHRDRFRRRPLSIVLQELDGLIAQGVAYVYFIDEIFLPRRDLLQALRARPVQFGIQTRIDLWQPELLDLLAEAGCVSVEAGVESISTEGRRQLDKNCRLDTETLQQRLIHAGRIIPFVQASLLDSGADDPAAVDHWRRTLNDHGVWANKPVPMFPYPGSPDYNRLWGPPDSRAWERAVDHYLRVFREFSDIQDDLPQPLEVLECCSSQRR